MYKKGDATIDKFYYDARGEGSYDATDETDERRDVIMLPHSCDEWVIGGVDEAKQMIEDLQALIVTFPEEVKTTNQNK